MIKRMGLADKVGHRRRLQYYFDQMVDMYVVGKTNEAKISLMYNLRFFKRWRRKWKRKKKRIKKLQKWKSYLLQQQAKRILHAWHAFSKEYKKRYRTSSRAMQIQRIISGNIPGPHKHLKHDDIMVLDELVVSLQSDAYVIMNKRIADVGNRIYLTMKQQELWQRPRANMALKGIEFPTMRVLIETTNMYVAHQLERTFGRIDSNVIRTTRSSYADIVSKLKYKYRDKDLVPVDAKAYSSSDDEADGTIDMTTFQDAENFNVVLDNAELSATW